MSPHLNTCRHTVVFYKDDAGLRHTIAPHIAAALRTGGPVLVIAKAQMRQEFALELHRQHVQGLPFGVARGPFVTLDAEQTLDQFCIDGRPDAALFQQVVGSAVRQLAAQGKYVTAYGEMVGILCGRGRFADAVRLEEMWNELLAMEGGRLFCGYASDLFDTPEAHGFREAIHAAHTDVEDTGATASPL
jgi:hypothetical protein